MMAMFPTKIRFLTQTNPTQWRLCEEGEVCDSTEKVEIQVLTEINADKKRLLTRGI